MAPRRTRWFARALVALGLATAAAVGSAAAAAGHPAARPAATAGSSAQQWNPGPDDWWW